MTQHRRLRLVVALLACLAGALLSGCEPATPVKPLTPLEIDARTTCDLDGMLLADYPGPKAQIRYAGQAEPTFFCDTVELFSTLLSPEQVRKIDAVWVQDMGKANWDQPRGNWFDPKTGYFVLGSKRKGSMGPTIAASRKRPTPRSLPRRTAARCCVMPTSSPIWSTSAAVPCTTRACRPRA